MQKLREMAKIALVSVVLRVSLRYHAGEMAAN